MKIKGFIHFFQPLVRRRRDREMRGYMHSHDFIQASRWRMLSGWCAKTEWLKGDASLLLHDWCSPAGKSLLVSDSFCRCQGQPHPASPGLTQPRPAQFIPLELWPDQLLQLSTEGSGFNSIRVWKLVTGGPGLGIPPLLPLCEGKEKGEQNTGKITFSLLTPSLPSLLLSLNHPLCGNRAVCSVASHWLNISMSKWTRAFALLPVPLHWLTDLH